MKKFAVITVNYNCFDHTKKLLRSLQSFDAELFDVFCVDNNSSKDDILEMQSYNVGNVKMLFSKENLGFSGGNNIAIKDALQSGYQYILLLNPDTILEDGNFFYVLEDEMIKNDAGIVGPLIKYSPDKEKVYFAGGIVNRFTGLTKMLGKGSIDRGQYNDGYECDFITGAAMLIRRDVFEKIGLLPEEYFLYFEESDFCLKAKKNGIKLFFTPKTCIYHEVSKSIGYISDIYLYYMIRNYRIFALKYVPWFYLPFFWLFYCFVWIPGYAFLAICRKNAKIRGLVFIIKGILNLHI